MKPIDPDLRTLRYTVTVAEHLSFRRAADALRIRQPARQQATPETGGDDWGFLVRAPRPRSPVDADGLGLHPRCPLHPDAARSGDRNGPIASGTRGGRTADIGILSVAGFGRLRGRARAIPSPQPRRIGGDPGGKSRRSARMAAGRDASTSGVLAGGYEASDLERLVLWEERIFARPSTRPPVRRCSSAAMARPTAGTVDRLHV